MDWVGSRIVLGGPKRSQSHKQSCGRFWGGKLYIFGELLCVERVHPKGERSANLSIDFLDIGPCLTGFSP